MNTWNTDAQLADSIDEKFLATNPQIDQFFSSGVHGKFLLVAAKGMGKTLLLRHKRKQIEQAHKDYFLIPRNNTADYVNPPRSPSKGMTELMKTKAFWQDVWTLSIAISVLLNFPHNLSESERESVLGEVDRAELPVELAKELSNVFSKKHVIQRPPSEVLDIFLQCSVKTIERVRSHAVTIVTALVNRHIDSGCAVFIDSFDQAISTVFPDNLDVWCGGQGGLLKAAWELSRHSRHLKIYTTIRQEAFAYFNDAEINNIKGSMLLIEYSKDNLRAIFTKAILHYEDVNSIEEFVGLKQIYNGYLKIREPIFDYIYRHTIGVPRWLMVIGEKISTARQERGVIADSGMNRRHQKLIAEIINEESSSQAAIYLEAEMAPFFRGDTPGNYIEGILGKVGSTVLSLANLVRISERFLATGWTGTKHPFCLLYNFGLLGYVAKNPSGYGHRQKFKKPYEFDWNYDRVLPRDPKTYYLIHPSLHHIIQTKNYSFKFNHVRIGDGLPWGKKEVTRIAAEKIRVFISYAHSNSDIADGVADVIEEYLSEKSVLHDIWFDKWKMKSGKWFHDQMYDGLSKSDYLILMVSKESLGSNAVAVEWKTKFADKLSNGEDTVIPFIIDDTPFSELPQYLENIHCYRYEGSRDKIVRLVDDILFWKKEETNGMHPEV
ncbi:MAG: toll/interleukin-1 receptor domain-containing protein [Cyclobacteriaceae bacterium]|nr:toll/interleukin-1 receptor domain-containing protein [Cyclobacteriaceae bacterium]